jgi:hypothetical protein
VRIAAFADAGRLRALDRQGAADAAASGAGSAER